MNGNLLPIWLLYPPIAALCIAQPWFSRRNVLFSVTFGNTEIWKRSEMRAVRRRYLLWSVVLCALIGIVGFFWSLRLPLLEAVGVNTGALFGMIGAEAVLFVSARRQVRRFKTAQQPDVLLVKNRITVETGMPDKQAVLGAVWLLVLLPMAVAAVVIAFAGYLYLPAVIPTHYGWSGTPDAFAAKSWGTVLFPLVIHLAVAAIIAVTFLFARQAPASVRGNPEAAPGAVRYRKVMAFFLLATGLFAQANFLLIQMAPFTGLPIVLMDVFICLSLLSIVGMVVVYVWLVRTKKPRGPILDDDAKWVLGMFYYNPGDPSVFVEKRAGIGYTLNFARPLAWLFVGAVVVFVIGTLIYSFSVK